MPTTNDQNVVHVTTADFWLKAKNTG